MKIFSYLIPILLLIGCSSKPEQDKKESLTDQSSELKTTHTQKEFTGNTQGTTYAVLFTDDIELTHKEIDETLHNFDMALSSYVPNSILTNINNAPAGKFIYNDTFNYFNRCVNQSKKVYEVTNGAFDPTVYPLVDGWGFMKDIQQVPDSVIVDSLLSLVGFQNKYHFTFSDSLKLNDSIIIKNTPNAKLDFNAIAQGLSVDVICELLDSKGAKNYFVEIGGELRVKGKNKDGVLWRIGIDKPIEKSTALNREFQEIIQINNKAVATSGSYRKFYEKNGVKYSHTLNPKTGYPVKHTLLSATVVANNCALADALATAFMVMGPKESVKFIKSNKIKNVELFLIFYNTKGRMETYRSPGFNELILKE